MGLVWCKTAGIATHFINLVLVHTQALIAFAIIWHLEAGKEDERVNKGRHANKRTQWVVDAEAALELDAEGARRNLAERARRKSVLVRRRRLVEPLVGGHAVLVELVVEAREVEAVVGSLGGRQGLRSAHRDAEACGLDAVEVRFHAGRATQ